MELVYDLLPATLKSFMNITLSLEAFKLRSKYEVEFLQKIL